MAIFKGGIALPRPFHRWELSAMVETQGSCEEAVRREGCEEEPERRGMWAPTLLSRVSSVQARFNAI